MRRKDIEKLFPKPGPEIEPVVEEEASVIWYGATWAILDYEGRGFGRRLRVRARASERMMEPPFGELTIDGSQRLTCWFGEDCREVLARFGIQSTVTDAMRVVGTLEKPQGVLRKTRIGKGEVCLASGRRLVLEPTGGRPTLFEKGLLAARHQQAWSDADRKARIIARTFLAPNLEGEEGIVVATLLVLGGFQFSNAY